MDFSSKELKKLSRSLLIGRYNSYTLPLILYFLADLAASFLPVALFPGNDAIPFVFRFIFAFILSAFFGMLGIGIIRITRCVCRKEPSNIKDLVYAFQNGPDNFIKIELIFAAIRSAFSLLTIIADRLDAVFKFSYLEYMAVLYGVTLLAYFLTMLVTLRLFFSVYYILDDPRISAVDALKMSLSATRGKTLKLLFIKLSFVGMYALGILSFMTGFLYVRPYMETTYMLCYYKITGQILPEYVNEQPPEADDIRRHLI